MKLFSIMLLCFIHVTLQQNCTTYPQTKVFKRNTQNYSLDNSNTWKDYPQLKISLQLGEPRLVSIGYTISIGSTGESHLVTRIIVDNAQIPYFRAISGNTVYHTNSVSGYVSLSQGTHDVTVQYRTPGTFTINSGNDWIVAQLQVTY